MAVESKNHHASDAVVVRVSQASRSMAQPANVIRGQEFPSLAEERQYIIERKQEIQGLLAREYSKSAYSQAQMKIRGRGSSSQTLTAWISTRARMDSEKSRLTSELATLEKRLAQVKGLMRDEALHEYGGDEAWQSKKHTVVLEMADDLAAVRSLLERLVERLGA